jgi:hypothetical protein
MVGTRRRWKCVEEARSIWKYLATTMGRKLDIRLLIEKKNRQSGKENVSPIT